MGTDFALPILNSVFYPGSSIDLYYGYYGIYTIEDTILQSNVILSDLNGTIINQNTYQYNETQPSSIDLFIRVIMEMEAPIQSTCLVLIL